MGILMTSAPLARRSRTACRMLQGLSIDPALVRHVSARSGQRRASREDAWGGNKTSLRSTAKIEDRVVRRSDVSNRRHAGTE